VIAAIVGDLPSERGEEPTIVKREDGSWLMDGSLDIDTVLRTPSSSAAAIASRSWTWTETGSTCS
jgi:hypothetical protein